MNAFFPRHPAITDAEIAIIRRMIRHAQEDMTITEGWNDPTVLAMIRRIEHQDGLLDVRKQRWRYLRAVVAVLGVLAITGATVYWYTTTTVGSGSWIGALYWTIFGLLPVSFLWCVVVAGDN